MQTFLLNVADTRYEALKDLFKLAEENGWVVVVAQRPLPSEARTADYSYKVYLYGCFYAVGTMERFGKTWEELDARLVELTDNEKIRAHIEKWIVEETGQPLEYWLNEEGLTMREIADMVQLPYVE